MNQAVAEMNWSRLSYPLDDPRVDEFMQVLDEVYALAENTEGFIWRIDGEEIERDLLKHGFDNQVLATVSVWSNEEALKRFTYEGMHGKFFDRRFEWFDKPTRQQLVVWKTNENERPNLDEAMKRLKYLEEHGSTDYAYTWEKSVAS